MSQCICVLPMLLLPGINVKRKSYKCNENIDLASLLLAHEGRLNSSSNLLSLEVADELLHDANCRIRTSVDENSASQPSCPAK